MSIVEKRRVIRELLKKVKDPEFLDEIEDLIRNGKKWTEEEKLDRNFGVEKKVLFQDNNTDRAKGMNMFLDDIWY